MESDIGKIRSSEAYLSRLWQTVQRLRPIDDAMFQKLAEDAGVCEEILRVILDDKELEVLEVVPQSSIKNLQGRSVRVDALCRMGSGRIINIEVQKSDDDDHFRRVRYNSSCMTANFTEIGERFESVPDVCVVYITAFDIFGRGRIIYHERMFIEETMDAVPNGYSAIYVNTAVFDPEKEELSALMNCFLQEMVDDTRFPRLSDRMKQFKVVTEVNKMCGVIEEFVNEFAGDIAAEMAQEMAQEMAEKIAEEKAEKLAEEKAVALAEEKAEKRLAAERLALMKEGAVQKNLEIAKAMKKEGMAADLIARVTGLTEAAVAKL